MSDTDPVIGRRPFTDGMTWDVFEDATGQYVVDEGERVYGVRIDDPDGADGVTARRLD